MQNKYSSPGALGRIFFFLSPDLMNGHVPGLVENNPDTGSSSKCSGEASLADAAEGC